ncbi:glycoside hydrolase family 3 N-terminal domain-containing protein [Ruixingdingia sedimenti]|uniref:beta-N-acetylhexosaminidase n=1 Tax=Ruixingdingia sedimenti TaxID=3073604 RepID=A0ABU1F4H4_9RHOB|nr:glycoside hydrolase family 3 N-terminal domain-containing protein [Xinfangfangia sp. LG-4]MDR5651719.1 glycoside hydrolase family 3 N-terminal domain-containing protein [Xinfangfangia sp. LG-4]
MTSAAILGCAGPVLGPGEAAFFREAAPWGFILFARNIEDPGQIRRLTAALRDAVGRDAPVFIDQEGGRVQRLRPPHWRDWPAPLDQVLAAGADAPRAMELRYRLIAADLRALGIDANCAPTCDIAGPATHPFLHNRCLGLDAAAVAAAARGAARGMLAGGVLPVIKHIPGHGRATADSHLSLPVVTTPLAELEATDFAPFRALADLPMAMTAHVVYTALDPDLPATLSPAGIAAIRGGMGFDGLLMTDDMSMQALSGDLGALTAQALAAGCDVALHCNGDRAEMAAVVAAAGPLHGVAADRAAAALARRHAPEEADLTALARDLAALADG